MANNSTGRISMPNDSTDDIMLNGGSISKILLDDGISNMVFGGCLSSSSLPCSAAR